MYLDQDFHFFFLHAYIPWEIFIAQFLLLLFILEQRCDYKVEFPPQIRFKHYIDIFFKAQIWQYTSSTHCWVQHCGNGVG